MSNIKPMDVVVVINDDDTMELHEGERYQVSEVSGWLVRLCGVNGWWAVERFHVVS